MIKNAIMDLERSDRIGFPEAVLSGNKLVPHINEILQSVGDRPLLLTRLDEEKFNAIADTFKSRLDYDPVSRTAWYQKTPSDDAAGIPRIAIVTAGTSDIPVAKEAGRTLGFSDIPSTEFHDVGVAGIWRLLERIDEIKRHEIVIAVAGMDAALPTVLGGLVPCAIVAVPTSVGYGVAEGGNSALHAMLASCAPGVSVVNIDNGYGAACAALRMLQSFAAPCSGTQSED